MLLQVDNTDAEGRLTLADALVYACNQGVDKVMSYFCAITCSFCIIIFENYSMHQVSRCMCVPDVIVTLLYSVIDFF